MTRIKCKTLPLRYTIVDFLLDLLKEAFFSALISVLARALKRYRPQIRKSVLSVNLQIQIYLFDIILSRMKVPAQIRRQYLKRKGSK